MYTDKLSKKKKSRKQKDNIYNKTIKNKPRWLKISTVKT